MERTYLQWNAANWITVVLMVAIGTAVWNAGIALYRSKFAS